MEIENFLNIICLNFLLLVLYYNNKTIKLTYALFYFITSPVVLLVYTSSLDAVSGIPHYIDNIYRFYYIIDLLTTLFFIKPNIIIIK